MTSVTVKVSWSDDFGQTTYRARGPVETHSLLTQFVAAIAPNAERLDAAQQLLRTGDPGPLPGFPELVDNAPEGVRLEQSNGVCFIEHMTFPERGLLVLRSSAMANFIETLSDMLASDEWNQPDATFPAIEVEILAAGPTALGSYLSNGGNLRSITRSTNGVRQVLVTKKTDDGWVWADESTGLIARPVVLPGESKPATPITLDAVIRLLRDVALSSPGDHPRSADPAGTLRDAAIIYEGLSGSDRAGLITQFADFERESLADASLGLCERALTEKDPTYLRAAAFVLELGAGHHDWRDVITRIAAIHHSAQRLNAAIPAAPIYPSFGDLYANFLERTAETGRQLENFGLAETQFEEQILLTTHLPQNGTTLGARRSDPPERPPSTSVAPPKNRELPSPSREGESVPAGTIVFDLMDWIPGAGEDEVLVSEQAGILTITVGALPAIGDQMEKFHLDFHDTVFHTRWTFPGASPISGRGPVGTDAITNVVDLNQSTFLAEWIADPDKHGNENLHHYVVMFMEQAIAVDVLATSVTIRA